MILERELEGTEVLRNAVELAVLSTVRWAGAEGGEGEGRRVRGLGRRKHKRSSRRVCVWGHAACLCLQPTLASGLALSKLTGGIQGSLLHDVTSHSLSHTHTQPGHRLTHSCRPYPLPLSHPFLTPTLTLPPGCPARGATPRSHPNIVQVGAGGGWGVGTRTSEGWAPLMCLSHLPRP